MHSIPTKGICLVAQRAKNPFVNAGNKGLIPGVRSSHREETGYPLQYSCLGNPTDRGARWATVHGVTRVGHSLLMKPPQPYHLRFQYYHFFNFFYIVVGFAIHWHESAMDLHVFRIPIPLPTSLPTPSSWVFPVHQPRALVSCIQPGLVICFTLDNIHVSMLFFQNIPPLPSPTESKSLFCTSVSLFLFCI